MAEQNNNNPQIQEDDGFSISFSDILENLIYYRKVFYIIAGAVFSLALVYALLATPIYRADVLIQVEDKKSSALGGALQDVSKAFEIQSSPIPGQIEIFKSRSVIGRAVDSLFLHTDVKVDNRIPLIGGLIYRLLPKTDDGLAIPPVSWPQMGWGGEDLVFESYNIPANYHKKPLYLVAGEKGTWNLYNDDDQLLATGRAGVETLSEDGQWQINIKTLRANPGTEFKLVRYSLQSRIEQITKRLEAKEAGKQSGLFRVSFDDPNAAFAQRLLNAVSQSYVDQNTERRAEEADKTLKFLTKKLPELADKMNAAETAFSNFRNQESTIDVPGEIKALLDQSVAIEKERMMAEIKKSEMMQRYQPSHPYVKAINSQIKQLKAENTALEKQINSLPQTQQEYLGYARDAEISTKLYMGLLDTAQQLQVTKAGTVGNVAVIDYAVAPEKPAKPNKILIVAIGGLLGVLLGGLGANLVGLMMGNVRDPKRLEEAIALKMLAILPLASEQEEAMANKQADEAYMLAEKRPNATSVEAIRSLRIALQFALLNKPRQKVVLITSAVPGQGKSFISANLTYLLAASGKKTLLIDADIRRTSLRNYFPVGKALGLSEVLQEKAQLPGVLIKNIYPNLDMVPAGRPANNPGELFVEGKLNEIVEWAAENYDLVMIDSPPVLPVNDSVVLSKMADVTVFVARQDKVSLHEINESIELFKKSGTMPDGMVFNSFVPSSVRYGMTRYGYYAYRYGGRYGRYGRYGNKYSAYDNYGLESSQPQQSAETSQTLAERTTRVTRRLGRSIQKRLTNLFRKIR